MCFQVHSEIDKFKGKTKQIKKRRETFKLPFLRLLNFLNNKIVHRTTCYCAIFCVVIKHI